MHLPCEDDGLPWTNLYIGHLQKLKWGRNFRLFGNSNFHDSAYFFCVGLDVQILTLSQIFWPNYSILTSLTTLPRRQQLSYKMASRHCAHRHKIDHAFWLESAYWFSLLYCLWMLLHFSWYSWRFSCIHKVVTMCTPSITWFVRPMEMCSQLIIIIIIIRFVNNWHLSQFSCFFDSPPLPAVHGGFNRICQEAQLICGSLGVHECVLQTACHLVHWGWEDQCVSPSQIFKIGRTVDNISRVPCTKVLSQSTSVLYTIRQISTSLTSLWHQFF